MLKFYSHPLPEEDILTEVLTGLRRSPKTLPPKYFYDEEGSRLFTQITRQQEYYPTRTEISIFRRHASDIAEVIGSKITLIEYGSGSSEKIRLLLEAVKPEIYAPLDISEQYLRQAVASLAETFPWLEIHATAADYSQEVTLPFRTRGRRVAFFPGSSIGNFAPPEAQQFLTRIRTLVQDDGGLLIGVDLKKDKQILDQAYNDKAGVTAAFNLNMLSHLNQVAGADFDREKFSHLAFYNEDEGRIEMHLEAQSSHEVNIGDGSVSLRAGERIHTENSYKYSIEEFEALASACGFNLQQRWTDENAWFAELYFLAA